MSDRNFRDWHEARAKAQQLADQMGRPMGIERLRGAIDGREFIVSYIATDPTKRYGREMWMEVVEPSPAATAARIERDKAPSGALNIF